MARQTSPLVELRFPVGGLDRHSGFDQQPPYTTPLCFNVRPFDVVNLASAEMHGMRQRGGARPGLVKAYAQQCGTGPFQMLSNAAVTDNNGATSHILLAVAGGTLYQNSSGAMVAVAGGPHFDTTIRLQGSQVGQLFYIADYRAVNVRSPLATPDGTIANGNRLSASSIADWTALGINTAKDVVWISGSVDVESNIFPITSVAAGYIEFGGTLTNQVGEVTWQIGRIPKVFDPANPTAALTNLMGTLPIPRANYNVGTVSIAAGVVTMSGGSWAGVPQATDDSMLTLTIPAVSGIGTEAYLVAVTTVNQGAGTCTLVDTTTDADRTNVAYTLEWASDFYGIPPLNCHLCCTYRGRLVLAGSPPNIWYMSRVLDPNDWDYGYDPNDASRPVAGTDTSAGGVPEALTAVMPHSDDYLLFACEWSLWTMRGDPAYGGTITATSRDIGVLGPGAWCNLPDSSIMVLSRDGIYWVPAGGQGYPQPLSGPKLPAELLNVNWSTNTIAMAYDLEARGIHLSITPTSGGAGTHFFVDTTVGGFWPVRLGNNGHQPTAMLLYAHDASLPALVLLGGWDGYLRKYSATATTDDGTAIASLVTYGPFRLGGPGYYGELLQIAADLDNNGQGVSWGIFPGDDAQAAVQSAVTAGVATGAPWTGSWVAGMNHRQFARASGAGVVIMVSGGYGWAIEGMRVEVKRKGPVR